MTKMPDEFQGLTLVHLSDGRKTAIGEYGFSSAVGCPAVQKMPAEEVSHLEAIRDAVRSKNRILMTTALEAYDEWRENFAIEQKARVDRFLAWCEQQEEKSEAAA